MELVLGELAQLLEFFGLAVHGELPVAYLLEEGKLGDLVELHQLDNLKLQIYIVSQYGILENQMSMRLDVDISALLDRCFSILEIKLLFFSSSNLRDVMRAAWSLAAWK